MGRPHIHKQQLVRLHVLFFFFVFLFFILFRL